MDSATAPWRVRGVPAFGLTATFLALAVLAPSAWAQTGAALTHYHRGESLYEAGNLTGALRAFERAYAADSKAHRGDRVGMHFEDYDPAFQLGRVHARLGNFEQAERFFAQCAAQGYTARSQNAEEFRRWRAAVERALAGARLAPTPIPAPPSPRPLEPTAIGPMVATPEPSPVPTHIPVPTPVSVALLRPSPSPRPTLALLEITVEAGREVPASVSPFETPPPGDEAGLTPPPVPADTGETVAGGQAAVDHFERLLPWVAGLAVAGLATLLVWIRRRGRLEKIGDGQVSFGRYAIQGFVKAGRNSFVYEGTDRRTGNPIALRIRRPDRPPKETARFTREAAALEKSRRSFSDAAVPALLTRGVHKKGECSLEYVALERLSGRSLLDLSRQARRRLDPALSLEILREIAVNLRHLRSLGLSQDELTAEDVFLLEPVPANAGNPIYLRFFGLCQGEADPARDALALEGIASELFRSRARLWDQDEWVATHVPTAVRLVLAKARESAGAPGSSFDDVESALIESTGKGRKGSGP